MNTPIPFKYTYTVVIEGTVTPGVPPIPCSNPDSPHFSDPGSDAEIEWSINREESYIPAFILAAIEDNHKTKEEKQPEWEDQVIDEVTSSLGQGDDDA